MERKFFTLKKKEKMNEELIMLAIGLIAELTIWG